MIIEMRNMRYFQQSQDLASWVVIGITRHFNLDTDQETWSVRFPHDENKIHHISRD